MHNFIDVDTLCYVCICELNVKERVFNWELPNLFLNTKFVIDLCDTCYDNLIKRVGAAVVVEGFTWSEAKANLFKINTEENN